MDGGSTDETVAVLRGYPHLQWVSEPDKGQTDAINKGFRRATGDWMMWLNADDCLLPSALSTVAEFAGNHPEADVIFGDCDYVEGGQVVQRKREFGFSFWMLLFYGCFVPSTATFLHRRIIEVGLLPDPQYRVLMDHEYYMRLAETGYRFVHVPSVLANFRWHDENVSRTNRERGRAERLQIQQLYLSRHGLSFLGHRWLLNLFYRGYQGRRVVGRFVRRTLPS